MSDGTPQLQKAPSHERYLSSGDESGTPPDDRRFRPDVEGLRAVAILLVVLYHAGVPGISGGFVGVDVFFVISGYVITGLLLRERQATHRTSLVGFYARRCRRILPAATLVILSAVLFSYLLVGVVTGDNTAGDGRWAAVFLANFHFESVGTDYLLAMRAPSPLQNYWSLSVEEQFYIVYPTFFFLMARARSRVPLRIRMTTVLVPVMIVSYGLSIVQTSQSPSAAFFSPYTRAWELALGALVAVNVPALKRLPQQFASALTWLGMALILYSTWTFNTHVAYPGSLVALPVVGAGLVIAGGVAATRSGAELFLGIRPAQWLGRLSYSLYLWHWPILIIAAQRAGVTQLPLWESLGWVLVAMGISMVTYRFVENPIRHSKLRPGQSMMLGLSLIAATVMLLTLVIVTQNSDAPTVRIVPAPNVRVEHNLVSAATKITKVPHSLRPALSSRTLDWGGKSEPSSCYASAHESTEEICELGDPNSKHLMVVYGDSHALMWLPAFKWVAATAHWRLVVLGKPYCPAVPITIANPPSLGSANSSDTVCDHWHTWATRWINRNQPQVLIVTQQSIYKVPDAHSSSPKWVYIPEWQRGLDLLFASFTDKRTRYVILGNIPVFPQPGSECLASHESNVQACSSPVGSSIQWSNAVEETTARNLGIQFIDVIPWLCSTACTAVIGNYNIYQDGNHINATWATYLEVVLGQALHLMPGN